MRGNPSTKLIFDPSILLLCIGFRKERSWIKTFYTPVDPCTKYFFTLGRPGSVIQKAISSTPGQRYVATKESLSRDASILPKHFTYIYIVEQATKKSKNTLEKGYKFLFENYCHDDYCRLIWTINSCRWECFKSLRKNERPHNVNSRDKCSCTEGGNGYCNRMHVNCNHVFS